ncbi:MAG: M14 family zinc carboxypeptidase [Eubacteriales bacterium]
MKSTLFFCLFTLLLLALIFAACRESDPASSSDTVRTSSPTHVSSIGTTVLPTPEHTTSLLPTVSQTETSAPDDSDLPDHSSLPAPATDEPTTIPPVTTTEAPASATTPAVTDTPPIVTTTAKPVTTTAKPVTDAPSEPPAPAVHWVVTCNEYINLRKEPSTASSSIARIPKGKSVELVYFIGSFAKIKYNGKIGFVNASYLTRPEGLGTDADLSVVQPVQNYSYQQMQTDLQTLAQKFPDLLTLSSIGKSEEGRDLTLAILGNPNAEHKIFLQASIHGREHIVTQIAMGEIDYILHHQDTVLENGMTIAALLDAVAIHIVPMSNPDGVTISQTGTLPPPFADQYDQSKAELWKANAKGIDLNANFDAMWDKYESMYQSTSPAFAGYKGTAPECAAESKALAEHLRANDFDLTLSYHTADR